MDERDNKYYDAMDDIKMGEYAEAEKSLLETLALDTSYVQTHVGFISLYEEMGDLERSNRFINSAFELTEKEFKDWPVELDWGFLENRAYLRAIQYKAKQLQDFGLKNDAIELYTLLLRLNPNDNQGIRYILAGLYEDISNYQISEMNVVGNMTQDWSELENLVERQNKVYKFWVKPE